VQFSVRIGEHDYGYRLGAIKRFLAQRDTVLAVVKFRGREVTHPELGEALLGRLLADLGRKAVKPTLIGKAMRVLIVPR
jgi:translation initiation factor IF-3